MQIFPICIVYYVHCWSRSSKPKLDSYTYTHVASSVPFVGRRHSETSRQLLVVDDALCVCQVCIAGRESLALFGVFYCAVNLTSVPQMNWSPTLPMKMWGRLFPALCRDLVFNPYEGEKLQQKKKRNSIHKPRENRSLFYRNYAVVCAFTWYIWLHEMRNKSCQSLRKLICNLCRAGDSLWAHDVWTSTKMGPAETRSQILPPARRFTHWEQWSGWVLFKRLWMFPRSS